MYNISENTKLSQNFRINEFACNDGSKDIMIDYELVQRLQTLRDLVKKPIKITSGYRTITYNKKCGGISTSNHLIGKAADIQISSMTPYEVAVLADKIGFLGIGVYSTFTHVDVCGSIQGTKLYWKQDPAGKKTIVNKLSETK